MAPQLFTYQSLLSTDATTTKWPSAHSPPLDQPHAMIVLNNTDRFARILDVTVPWAHSYADMRSGKTDLERRESYGRVAVTQLRPIPSRIYWWAFRITVFKTGRPLDVGNIARTIIDSFSVSQTARDQSSSQTSNYFLTTLLTMYRSCRSPENPAPPRIPRALRYSPV